MNTHDPIQQLREEMPRIPDPDALTREVMDRIRTEVQVDNSPPGLLAYITGLLTEWRLRSALAAAAAAMLLLFSVQVIDIARAVHSIEQQYSQQLPPAGGLQAMYTTERDHLPDIHGNATDVLQDIGLNPLTINGYVAVRKTDIQPLRHQLFPLTRSRLKRLRAAGFNPAELPALLNDVRSRVFLSLRFPVGGA